MLYAGDVVAIVVVVVDGGGCTIAAVVCPFSKVCSSFIHCHPQFLDVIALALLAE